MLHFKQIGKDRYKVLLNKDDTEHHGTVERQEYVSIKNGKRTRKVIWTAHGVGGGWRATKSQQFDTREAAAAFLIKDNAKPYAERDMHWHKNQGESK